VTPPCVIRLGLPRSCCYAVARFFLPLRFCLATSPLAVVCLFEFPYSFHVCCCPISKLTSTVLNALWSAELPPGQPTLEGHSADSNFPRYIFRGERCHMILACIIFKAGLSILKVGKGPLRASILARKTAGLAPGLKRRLAVHVWKLS